MKIMAKASLTALLLTGALHTTSIANAKPMTAEDLATLNRLGAPAVSPDEKWAAFQVTETEPENYKRNTALYLLDLYMPDARPIRIADQPGASEHSPSFSADGRNLYYLSNANGSEQLWRIGITAGGAESAPEQTSDLKADIAGFKISPDGAKIAIWGDIAKDCLTFGCAEEDGGDGNKAEPGPGTGREYDELFVRHWSSWETPGNYSRIFAFDLKDGKVSGNGVALDNNLVGDSPTKPFGGGEEIAWTANSGSVIYALRLADRNEPRSTDVDLYDTALDLPGAVSNLTGANEATDTLPAPSPDGKWLAYAAMERPGYESDKLTLMLRNLETSETRPLTKDWERSVGSIAWAKDGGSLIVTAQDVLDHPAYRVTLDGKVTRLTGKGNVANTIPLKNGGLIYTKNSLKAPNNLFRRDASGSEVQLTNINGRKMADIDEVSTERFSFKGANDDTVWGQIIKPLSTNGKLPMAFLVHGGPQGSFGDSWSFRWNPKVMASQGYAVVTIDFHGSAGYGQDFMDSINQDWGGKPLTDLKLGFDAALKEDSQIDGEHACALGASYGGYMMNWIAGNWPDRFDCIINHAGIFDLRSFAFSTEELWFDQWDHGGPWWKRADAEKWNPINHIENWKTPMLFIHGEKDFRIPYTQSLMPFTYAQERNIPSKLLIFPDENHWILKGKNSVQWHRAVFDWMKKWTSGGQEGED